MTPTQPRVTCAAQVSWIFGDYGQRTPLYCHGRVGLRYVEAADGRRIAYCSKHAARVERQVGRGAA